MHRKIKSKWLPIKNILMFVHQAGRIILQRSTDHFHKVKPQLSLTSFETFQKLEAFLNEQDVSSSSHNFPISIVKLTWHIEEKKWEFDGR